MIDSAGLVPVSTEKEFQEIRGNGIKGDIKVFVMHSEKSRFQQLLPGQLQKISSAYPNKADIGLENDRYQNGEIVYGYCQMIGYQDLWVQKTVMTKEMAPENTRSINTLLKMIITMAIKGYGYDPKAKQSPIPKELSNDINRITGEVVDPDTIKQWLTKAYKGFAEGMMKP